MSNIKNVVMASPVGAWPSRAKSILLLGCLTFTPLAHAACEGLSGSDKVLCTVEEAKKNNTQALNAVKDKVLASDSQGGLPSAGEAGMPTAGPGAAAPNNGASTPPASDPKQDPKKNSNGWFFGY